ncbi:hypothetical protein [Rhodococcoides fascians]|uniref:hypothetical protein n=1 Tax=Rhodococcoides fascians TaxID=1828 RepID=UPI00068C2FCE|nr:hypothetical protein [Rhodococcus fascians]
MSTVDVSTVTAGEYQLIAALFDQQTSKLGEPFDFKRYRKGDVVTLNVEEAKRLVAAGAVVEPGSIERAAAEQARRVYENALAALPDSVRREVLAVQNGEASTLPDAADADSVERPAKSHSKAKWEDYAVHLGWDRAAAEALTKPDLIAAIDENEDEDDDVVVPATVPDTAVDGGGDAATGVAADAADTVEVPLKSATEEEWVAYAKKRGLSDSDVDGLNRQALIDLLT